MPSYELGYFNARGRAEVARYLFALSKTEYKDTRFDGDTWRSQYKDSTPFGQAPFLKVDGQMIADSQAIARYLAKEFGYSGSSNLEEALINQAIGISEDVFTKLIKIRFVLKTEEDKAAAKKELEEQTLPKYCEYLSKNFKDSGYLVGGKLSLADVTAFSLLEVVGVDKCAEEVQKYFNKISEIPELKKWRDNRPKTEN